MVIKEYELGKQIKRYPITLDAGVLLQISETEFIRLLSLPLTQITTTRTSIIFQTNISHISLYTSLYLYLDTTTTTALTERFFMYRSVRENQHTYGVLCEKERERERDDR